MQVKADEESCPACGVLAYGLTEWRYSGLGNSIFNYTAQIRSCRSCGLVYVHNITDEILAKYYAEECSYFENAHFSVTAPENMEKYSVYAGLLTQHGVGSVPMADIGCGRGGFISWLSKTGWDASCSGVDMDVRSLQQGRISSPSAVFRTGDALKLPLGDSSMGLLTYFHVLEHIRNLQGVLNEASRVLYPGGHLLIEVPDAESYKGFPIGSGFWISIREHVFHYTARALTAALNAHGFEVRAVVRRPMPTPELFYPSLMVLGRKTEQPVTAAAMPATRDVAAYVLESKQALLRQARSIEAIAAKQPVTIWGCSAALFSVLPLVELKQFRICDSSKLKQSTLYRGRSVEDPEAVPVGGGLIIASYLHGKAIQSAAARLGWPEADMHVLH